MKMSWKLSKQWPGISKLVRCTEWLQLRCHQEATLVMSARQQKILPERTRFLSPQAVQQPGAAQPASVETISAIDVQGDCPGRP